MKSKTLIIFFCTWAMNLGAQKNLYIFSDSFHSNYSKNNDNQSAAAYLSFIGEHKKAKELFARDNTSSINFFPKTPSRYLPIPAIDFISENASKEQIIIINEAHHNARHRVFTTKILMSLYDKGFRYFSAETLTHLDIERLSREKFPNEKTGYYTAEPNYGNLIREAVNLGYKIFAYEDESQISLTPECMARREENQAKNIKKILDKDPKAKILIHCGFGHHNEMCLPDLKLMGCLLKEYTGINPYTIDQIKDVEVLNKETKDKLSQNQNINYSVIFVDSLNNTLAEKPLYDLSVFHPKDNYIYGRPMWLFDSIRKPYQINTQSMVFPCIIKAFLEKEYNYCKKQKSPNPIPYDVIEVKTKEENKALSLRKGKYVLEIVGAKNNRYTKKVEVDY